MSTSTASAFELGPYSERDGLLLHTPIASRRSHWAFTALHWLLIVASLIFSIVALTLSIPHETPESARSAPAAAAAGSKTVSRIAFGSCSSYDLRPQPVWTHGVLPLAPDAWIWLGDMAYMDQTAVSCTAAPQQPHCNCSLDWMRGNQAMCTAGDLDHARRRLAHQVGGQEYRTFLEFMCPGAQGGPGGGLAACRGGPAGVPPPSAGHLW
ncbi:hypothetical protein V8C86DRAFT_451385 [Haematococcus lacustris]